MILKKILVGNILKLFVFFIVVIGLYIFNGNLFVFENSLYIKFFPLCVLFTWLLVMNHKNIFKNNKVLIILLFISGLIISSYFCIDIYNNHNPEAITNKTMTLENKINKLSKELKETKFDKNGAIIENYDKNGVFTFDYEKESSYTDATGSIHYLFGIEDYKEGILEYKKQIKDPKTFHKLDIVFAIFFFPILAIGIAGLGFYTIFISKKACSLTNKKFKYFIDIACSDYIKTLAFISSVMLLIAILYHSIGYYDLLKLVISTSSGIILFNYLKIKEKSILVLIFLFILLLFNPIAPVKLDKTIWSMLNIISFFFFIFYALKNSNIKVKVLTIIGCLLIPISLGLMFPTLQYSNNDNEGLDSIFSNNTDSIFAERESGLAERNQTEPQTAERIEFNFEK